MVLRPIKALKHANKSDVHSSLKANPTFEYRKVCDLQIDPRNARTHSGKQIGQLAASLRQFGFTNPVLIDAEGMIIAGHGRIAAARQIGLTEVPTLRLNHMSPAERRAYVIADNRLAENAGWDHALLAVEFKALLDLDFDVALTGFDIGDVDIAIDLADGAAAEDVVPKPDRGPPVSQLGDLWQLGPHRLFCGSALEIASYQTLMGDERATMVFTDSPYNVPIAGHVSGQGHHREFAMASGEMTVAAFTDFLKTAFKNLAAFTTDGSIHFICMDWRHMRETLAAAEGVFSELKNLIVWNKSNAGMGSLYRSKHELIFVYKKGSAPHLNAVQLGKHGRNRSNVWDYPGQNTFHRNRDQDLADHPTVKPVALVADAIRDVSARGAIVLDVFAGSGTTIVAAEKTGRIARAIELEPQYCDVAVRRWQKLTGLEARHASANLTFETLKLQRSEASDAA